MSEAPDVNLRDLLDAFASTTAAPAGGSAAALAGAVGASLLIMVADLSKARTRSPAESAELAGAAGRLRPLRDTLAGLIDADSEAFASVMTARRLPGDDDARAAQRRQALDAAVRRAIDTPLDTIRACRQALRDATLVAAHSTRDTGADVGVAIELLRAAARGAGMNVTANLASLADADYVARVNAEWTALVSEIGVDADRALARLAR